MQETQEWSADETEDGGWKNVAQTKQGEEKRTEFETKIQEQNHSPQCAIIKT